MTKTKQKPQTPVRSTRLVRRAGLDYCKKALAYNRDCNTRRLKRPDGERRRLREESQTAFQTLMSLLTGTAPNAAGEP